MSATVATRRNTGATRRVREPLVSRGSAMLIMAVFTVYFLLPLWWLLVASSKDTGDILTTNPLWFADFRLFANIGDLFAYRDGIYLRWLGNSLLYAGLGGAIATLLAAMRGTPLRSTASRGGNSSSTSCSAACSFLPRRSLCRCS